MKQIQKIGQLAGMCAAMSVSLTVSAANNFRYTFPEWKGKAVTLAYDDGTIHDRKMVEILNRYGLKATFYLSANRLDRGNFLPAGECADLYRGHEIGSHGLNHVAMKGLPAEELEKEIREDLAGLEKIAGYPIRCFAYPYGQYDDSVQRMLKKYGIAFARTTGDSGRWSLQREDLAWQGTCHHDRDLMERTRKFLAWRGYAGVLGVFSVWGHSYEFNQHQNWELLEEFCKKMSAARKQIWFATNGEVYGYLDACRKIQSSLNGKIMVNPTAVPVYGYVTEQVKENGKLVTRDKPVVIPPRSYEILEPVPGLKYPEGDCLVFPGGRTKALTFSYDDGSYSDPALVAVFNRYGVKGTFNVNSYRNSTWTDGEGKPIYEGHEVASHGFNHVTYSLAPKSVGVQDIVSDRMFLEEKTGTIVRGFAYPNGNSHCYSDQMVEILRGLDMAYARGTTLDTSFSLPENWYNWEGTGRNTQTDFVELADRFLATEKVPALCYIWGHSTEFVKNGKYDHSNMEQFLEKLAHRPEIWYATNIEIYDYVEAARSLEWAQDRSFVKNPSAVPIYYVHQGKLVVLLPGELHRF